MSTTAVVVTIVVILVLVWAVYYYSTQPTGEAPGVTPTPTGQETPLGGTTNGTVQVAAKGFAFGPATTTIKVGTTVTWTNGDTVNHDVVTDPSAPAVNRLEGLKSPTLKPGESFSYTFNKVGTWNYYCSLHPIRMKGQIIVTE